MLLRRKIFFLINFLTFSFLFSQPQISGKAEKPRLVVGIVIDQMRQEYLYRFRHRFGKNGFNRLLEQGLQFTDARYNYVPTFTGPGHASIYTGSTPRYHGIAANDWYIRHEKKEIYCVNDNRFHSVPEGYKDGNKSAFRLKCTNISDELKIQSPSSKVISISLKDRSAILPAGHTADGVYWLDDSAGHFITSNYYTQKIPDWILAFNQLIARKKEKFITEGWNTVYPLSTYTASLPDDFPFEKSPFSQKTTFPYTFEKNTFRNPWIKSLPLGNTLLRELASQAVVHEQLGKDPATDLLLISFSSTDYVGHYFGPRSVELEDIYIRLDRELDSLFTRLDQQVGKHNYVVFITADHGCSENVEFLRSRNIPSGTLTEKQLEDSLRLFFKKEFGNPEWLEKVSNFLIYLSPTIDERKKNEVIQKTSLFLRKMQGISSVYNTSEINLVCPGNVYPEQLNFAGYTPELEADLIYTPEPGWLDYGNTGTTHGVCYSGDTHVPLLWWGKGIPAGIVHQKKFITQIVPTLCFMLKIPIPSCCFSEAIPEILKNYE